MKYVDLQKKNWFMLIDSIDNVWPRFGWSWERRAEI